jgi:hypothetical protein
MFFRKGLILILAATALWAGPSLFAMGESQTLTDELSDLQNSDMGHGVLVSANRQAVYVQKYDLEKQENIVVTFNLTENFKIKNVNELSQLSPGDMIEFSYYTKNDQFYLSRLVVHKQKPAQPVKEFDF